MKNKSLIVTIKIIILGILFIGCDKEYSHFLSAKEKKLLLYNLNDTLMFKSNTDTIIAFVKTKSFYVSSNKYPLQPGIHHDEKGIIEIYSIDSLQAIVGKIELNNVMGTKTLYFRFKKESFGYNDISFRKDILFNTEIRNNNFTERDDSQQISIVEKKPIFNDVYLFIENEMMPDSNNNFKLYLSKNDGYLSLVINNTDSIGISKVN